MPLVSVIMNCHNCSKYLPQALDSVYQQTFKDYEIIFWDNQSTDSSGEIALSYGEPLRYFRGEEFLPLGAARNAAIEKAEGRYIAFLDCDDIWLPEKLEKQVALLESNRELGLVYSDSYVIDGNGDLRENTCFCATKPAGGNAFNELFQFNFIPMLTVVIRREVLDKVGVFNPRYEIAEEYDLWLRIAEYYPIDFIEQPLAKFRSHAESGYQKNAILSRQEVLQITEYWRNRNPQLGRMVRLRKGLELCPSAALYVYRYKNKKAIKQFMNFIKYWLVARA